MTEPAMPTLLELVSDRDGEGNRKRLMGRIAAVFYVGSGLLSAVTVPLPGPADLNRSAVVIVSILAVAVGVFAWLAPWERWPRAASLALAPVALALIGAGNAFGGSNPYAFSIFFVVVFVWVGIAHPPGTSLLIAPLAAAAYVVPVLALPGDHAVGVGSAALVIPVSVLVGEALAWIEEHLRRAQEELRRKGDYVGLLQDIAVAANESRSVEDAVRTSIERICGHTGWPLGHAFLLDDETGELVPSGIWSVASNAHDTFRAVTDATRLGPAVGLPARVKETGEPAWVDDLAEDPTFLSGDLAAELGVRGCFAFPVLIGREVVAVLEFFLDRPARADHQLLDVMAHVGAQLGRVVERRRAGEAVRAEEIAHRALHDSLTGLPNITLFTDRLVQAVGRLERHPQTIAVMFLDLDRFKYVNDTLGHAAANELLVEVVRRIESVIRPVDTLARFGGDEFVVLCEDLPGKDEALRIAGRITETVSAPFEIADRMVKVSASVGIAITARPGEDPDELIHHADSAMYRAKRRGRARYEVFDERMRAQDRGRRRVEAALRMAVERNELRLHVQPVVRPGDGVAVGAEALVRWRHPERGVMAAGQFLRVAEETGLITQIDAWVLEQACRWLKAWEGVETPQGPFWLSVNLSARQLARPELAPYVRRCLARGGVQPSRLVLEIREHALIEEPNDAIRTGKALKDLGVRLAVDDFGIGYSSIGYLKRFPIDILKVDRSLIGGLGRSEEDRAIVTAVVNLAAALDLTTVAVGVETDEQAEAVRSLGCDLAQGNHWARSRTPESLGRLLTKGALVRGA